MVDLKIVGIGVMAALLAGSMFIIVNQRKAMAASLEEKEKQKEQLETALFKLRELEKAQGESSTELKATVKEQEDKIKAMATQFENAMTAKNQRLEALAAQAAHFEQLAMQFAGQLQAMQEHAAATAATDSETKETARKVSGGVETSVVTCDPETGVCSVPAEALAAGTPKPTSVANPPMFPTSMFRKDDVTVTPIDGTGPPSPPTDSAEATEK